jgi:hypothetical protein
MIPSYRQAFNANFTPEKYERLRREMTSRCGMEVPFALCETPCFFPSALVERMGEDGKALIRQLVENPEYRARSEASIPAEFRAPNESPRPMFIQVDFGLVRGSAGELQPKLVELQAFPSLYAYQPVLSQAYIDVFSLDREASLLSERAGLGCLPTAFAGRDRRRARSGECGVDGGASGGAENASGFSFDGEAARHSHGVYHEDS